MVATVHCVKTTTTKSILQFQESVDQEELVINFTSVEKTHQFQYILSNTSESDPCSYVVT